MRCGLNGGDGRLDSPSFTKRHREEARYFVDMAAKSGQRRGRTEVADRSAPLGFRAPAVTIGEAASGALGTRGGRWFGNFDLC